MSQTNKLYHNISVPGGISQTNKLYHNINVSNK